VIFGNTAVEGGNVYPEGSGGSSGGNNGLFIDGFDVRDTLFGYVVIVVILFVVIVGLFFSLSSRNRS